jgi:hypothetical protein
MNGALVSWNRNVFKIVRIAIVELLDLVVFYPDEAGVWGFPSRHLTLVSYHAILDKTVVDMILEYTSRNNYKDTTRKVTCIHA